MAQLADAISKVNDPAQRNALAMQVLGKSYSELMPLLAQGGDEIRRQATDSAVYAKRMGEMAKQAGEFNDRLDELKQASESASISLTTRLMPSLVDTANRMADFAEKGQPMMALLRGIGGIGQLPFDLVLGSGFDASIGGQIKDLQQKLDDLQRHRKDAAGKGLLFEWMYGTKGDLDREIEITKNQIAGLAKYADKLRPPGVTKDSDTTAKSGTSALISGKAAKATLDLIDPFGPARRAAEDAAFKGLIDSQNAAFDALNEARDYQIQQDEQHAANLGRLRAAHIAILDPIQQYREKLDEVQTLLDAGEFTPDQAVAANLYWQEQIDGAAGFGEALKQSKSEFDLFAENALKGFQDGLADFLFDPFADGLDGMVKGFASTLQRMAAEAVAADITRSIFGNTSSAGGGQNLFGAAAELFGFANGGAFTVGGGGGTDSQIVAFRATPGEEVAIRTPAQQRERQQTGGGVTINGPLMVVNAQDANSFNKSSSQILTDLDRALRTARRNL